jgi:hypothetical protein
MGGLGGTVTLILTLSYRPIPPYSSRYMQRNILPIKNIIPKIYKVAQFLGKWIVIFGIIFFIGSIFLCIYLEEYGEIQQ